MTAPAEQLALAIFRRFPPRETIFKDPGPRPQTEYDDEAAFGFHRYFGEDETMFRDRDVLDLGSGYGGRTVRFREIGARSVVGLEVEPPMAEHGAAFAAERGVSGVRFVTGFGERLPLEDQSVDLVVMNDVMEHVIDPAAVVSECHRVLRPGGRVATVFPPYYDLTSGSHLHGYATTFPGLNLLLPTRTLRAAVRRRLDEQGIDYRPFFREVESDKLFNQNGLTVRGFKRLVRDGPLSAERVWYLGHRDHRLSQATGLRGLALRPIFLLSELPAQVPGLQEMACLRICALLRRPD